MRFERETTYNTRSQVTSETTTSRELNENRISVSTHYYDSAQNGTGNYLGVATRVATAVSRVAHNSSGTTGDLPDTDMRTSFEWWDGAVQASSVYTPDTANSGTTWTSTYSYDGSGHIAQVSIADGRSRTLSYVTDAAGQVMRRKEVDNQSGTGDPNDRHYYFGGVEIGQVSNNGTPDMNYMASIGEHQLTPWTGPFHGGGTTPTSHADFDRSYVPINGINLAQTPGRYTVQELR